MVRRENASLQAIRLHNVFCLRGHIDVIENFFLPGFLFFGNVEKQERGGRKGSAMDAE
jgi:hypothetical protein